MQNTFLHYVFTCFSSVRIDRRLGYFQQKFNLCGNEVRQLSTRQPKIITYNLHHINTNTFVIKEEMGFNDVEAKHLILFKPNLWLISMYFWLLFMFVT